MRGCLMLRWYVVQVDLVEFPKPWPLFYAVLGLSTGYMAFAFFRTWRLWSRGIDEPTAGRGDYKRSSLIWLSEVLLQRQLRMLSFGRWLVHLSIFYGFMGLSLLSVAVWILNAAGLLALSSTSPRFYLHPEGYIFIKIWGDSFGLLLFAGLVIAGIRRLMALEERQTSNQMDAILLALLLAVTLSGFGLEGLRLAVMPSEIARYSFIGRLFSPSATHTLAQLRPWLTACWTLHVLLVSTLIAYLPHSKLMHSLLAPVIIGMNAAEEYNREDLYWPETEKYREPRSPRG